MARIRTFIAVDVGTIIRDRLIEMQASLAKEVADVKWVEPDNLHLTLLFLGEVNDRDLLTVCRCVSKATVARAAFPLEVRGIGCFPNPRRPRVLWAGIAEGAEELIALHADLEPPLLEQGCYRREERRYTPHITLGRVNDEQAAEPIAKLLPKHQAWSGGHTMVKEILVMSSELTSKGPTYAILSRGRMSK